MEIANLFASTYTHIVQMNKGRERKKDRETEEHVDPVFIRQRELRVEYAENTAFLLDIRVSWTDRAVIFLHFVAGTVRALFKAISQSRAKLISFLFVCSSCCFEHVDTSDIFFTDERFIYAHRNGLLVWPTRSL